MLRAVISAVALLLRPVKATGPVRKGVNPLARVRAGGLTLDPRPVR